MKYKRNAFSNVLHDSLSPTYTRAFLLITLEHTRYGHHNIAFLLGEHNYYNI